MSTTALCKKCGAEHPINQYAENKYYICESVKRIILLAPENEKADKQKQADEAK